MQNYEIFRIINKLLHGIISMTHKEGIPASEVISYIDSELAKAVSTARRIANNINKEQMDNIICNFLLTTGARLAHSGGMSREEIQEIIRSVLE